MLCVGRVGPIFNRRFLRQIAEEPAPPKSRDAPQEREAIMARPIEPTPQLGTEDSKRLLHDLEKVCSPAEAVRRIDAAEREFERIMTRGRQGQRGGKQTNSDRSQ
jgi:hypothetical protein